MYRRDTGSYAFKDGQLLINMEYATCGSLGNALIYVTGNPDDTIAVRVEGGSDTTLFKSMKKYSMTGLDLNSITIFTEDKTCNILSKADVPKKDILIAFKEKTDLRLPASLIAEVPQKSSICCKTCTHGKACGDTCISKSRSCNKGPGCACDK